MSKQVEYFLAPPSPFVYLGHARFVEIANSKRLEGSTALREILPADCAPDGQKSLG